jgi:glycerol-3-phosphate cytidylyltransferase
VDRPEKNKPVQNIVERQLQVKGCRYVDEVLVYETEQDVLDILAGIQWDVRIIGEEYENAPYTGRDEYKDNPRKEIYYNSRQHGFSSSELRDRTIK